MITTKEAIDLLKVRGIDLMFEHETREAFDVLFKSASKDIALPYKMKHLPGRTFRNGEGGEIINVFAYCCPECGQEQGDSDWDGKPNAEWLEYCDRCGQRIDWTAKVEEPDVETPTECHRILLGHIVGE